MEWNWRWLPLEVQQYCFITSLREKKSLHFQTYWNIIFIYQTFKLGEKNHKKYQVLKIQKWELHEWVDKFLHPTFEFHSKKISHLLANCTLIWTLHQTEDLSITILPFCYLRSYFIDPQKIFPGTLPNFRFLQILELTSVTVLERSCYLQTNCQQNSVSY